MQTGPFQTHNATVGALSYKTKKPSPNGEGLLVCSIMPLFCVMHDDLLERDFDFVLVKLFVNRLWQCVFDVKVMFTQGKGPHDQIDRTCRQRFDLNKCWMLVQHMFVRSQHLGN